MPVGRRVGVRADGARRDLNNNPTGQCSEYLTNLTCVFNALQGEGSFCQPFGGYGDWLQAVGQFYCGQ